MNLIFLNSKTNIEKYKNKDVLNLCIHATFEKYFDINPFEYFNLVEPIQSLKFKDSYLKKVDHVATHLLKNRSSINNIAQILSYRTFSKLSVSDNLVDKFWVIQQIKSHTNSNIFIFIDDRDIYNLYFPSRFKFSLFEIIPLKQFYYFSIFILNKIRAYNYSNKIKIANDFKVFVGNKFELKRNLNSIYDEYFFSKYWKNDPSSLLLLNIGDWNYKIKVSSEIIFKESFLKMNNIFALFYFSLKNFYNPIQILENSIEDRLININLRSDVKSGSFIDSFQNFYIYSNLLIILKKKQGKIIIPHEGRSYERIICSVFQKSLIKVVGYAHFPVSDRILNYNYGDFESFIYNKFTFFTLSQNNFNYFKNIYKWPVNRFSIGAHLKAKPIIKALSLNKEFDILILLGNELNQNIKLLTFIKNSLLNLNLKVLVRLHPSSIGLKHLEKLFVKYNFSRINNNSLSNDVELTKVIVYGDTGAAVDCLNFNVPLCYLNDDNCLLSDRINELIDGHYRFYNVNEFRSALPSLLLKHSNVRFDSIKLNYISALKPDLFTFDK